MDDTNKDDTEIFQDILQFLNRHSLTSVKAILWTVHPGRRRDATLCKQARFINAFAENNIWNNVIIICKICSPIIDHWPFLPTIGLEPVPQQKGFGIESLIPLSREFP